jgi:hypothetical protein
MIVAHGDTTVRAETYLGDYERVAERVLEPHRRARIAARVRSTSLDRALIEGADPASSPRLAARAALLTSRQSRVSIADGLERLVRAAQGPQRRWWSLSWPSSVLANSSELHALASLLHDHSPVYARGVAILNQLLTDGAGSGYGGDGEALARTLGDARLALER